MSLTFATFLTPAGIVVAGGIVTVLVEYLKGTFTGLDQRVSGALLAFIFTAVLYILTAFAIGVSTLDAGLNVFAAWLTCGAASIGIHSSFTHIQEVAKGG